MRTQRKRERERETTHVRGQYKHRHNTHSYASPWYLHRSETKHPGTDYNCSPELVAHVRSSSNNCPVPSADTHSTPPPPIINGSHQTPLVCLRISCTMEILSALTFMGVKYQVTYLLYYYIFRIILYTCKSFNSLYVTTSTRPNVVTVGACCEGATLSVQICA